MSRSVVFQSYCVACATSAGPSSSTRGTRTRYSINRQDSSKGHVAHFHQTKGLGQVHPAKQGTRRQHWHQVTRSAASEGAAPAPAPTSRPPRVVCAASSSDIADVAVDVELVKKQVLQLAALTDRGQRHNRVVSDAYQDQEADMQTLLGRLASVPFTCSEDSVQGAWDCVYSTCELFRSSPFFMAVESAFDNQEKSDLFFRLHYLQVMSWGASTVGRVSQRLDFSRQVLESEFDTILFGSTVIPLVGWFKLLPTFGGRILSEAKGLRLDGRQLTMELDRTTFKGVDGVPPGIIGRLFMDRWFPTNSVWKILPWNRGRAPAACSTVVYVDEDMRVMQDMYGQYFVYTRPMVVA